jgi:hypothetical protein
MAEGESVEVIEVPQGTPIPNSNSSSFNSQRIDPGLAMFRLNRNDIAMHIEMALRNQIWDFNANGGRGGFKSLTIKESVLNPISNSFETKEKELPPLIQPEEAITEIIDAFFKGIIHKGSLISYYSDKQIPVKMHFFRDHINDILLDGQLNKGWRVNCNSEVIFTILEENYEATLYSALKGGEREAINKTTQELQRIDRSQPLPMPPQQGRSFIPKMFK